jgi:alpha-D-ribose 1-methylphosphonate 5-triphosphate synthase subunit PhnH
MNALSSRSMPAHSPVGAGAWAVDAFQHEDPVRAGQHTFRTLLTALATPGSVHQLGIHPTVGHAGPVGNPWLASTLVCLLDHEVTLAVPDTDTGRALANLLFRRTRTPAVSEREADFVVGSLIESDPELPERLKRGGLEYPDDAATLLLTTTSLLPATDPAAALVVSGPGVKCSRELWLPGVTDAWLAARDAANRSYPMGIDIFVIDDAGRVLGLPRTSAVVRRPDAEPGMETKKGGGR